jgi:hypothetical protein
MSINNSSESTPRKGERAERYFGYFGKIARVVSPFAVFALGYYCGDFRRAIQMLNMKLAADLSHRAVMQEVRALVREEGNSALLRRVNEADKFDVMPH